MNRAYEKYGYTPYSWGEKQSIELYLTNFDDFMDLLEVRRFYGKQGIGNFYILNGRYFIDEFGQISKVVDGLEKLKGFIKIPLVLTNDEFHDLVYRYNRSINAITPEEHKNLVISRSMSASLPDRNTVCPYCGKGWTLDNIDDCLHHNSEWKDYPARSLDLYGDVLWDFVGQPLEKAWDFFRMRSSDSLPNERTWY